MYDLVLSLTGSATAVATMMVVQAAPIAIVGPFAGVIVDRFDRRRVMIAADLIRGVLMLGLLLVRHRDQVWMAYAITALSVAATGFFEPARTSVIPGVTAKEDLLTANSLASATWSAMLAIGAALGGFTSAALGRDAAFIVNSASFFISAAAIFQVKHSRIAEAGRELEHAAPPGLRDLREGYRYVRGHPSLAAYIGVKGSWAIAGGMLLLYTVYGERIFPIAGSSAAGIGVLYAARGIGAGVGALFARSLGADVPTLRSRLAPSFLAIGACYALMSVTPTLWLTALVAVVAHAFGSLLWIASTLLLQFQTDDRFRGRVFAVELMLFTLVSSASSYLTAIALDVLQVSPRVLALVIGAWYLVPGLWWVRAARKSQG